MTPVERVARSIARITAIEGDGEQPWTDAHVNDTWRLYVDEARAAIAALLDPPPEINRFNGSANWTAMITALLDDDKAKELGRDGTNTTSSSQRDTA